MTDATVNTKNPASLSVSPVTLVAVHDGDTFRMALPMHALIPGAVVGGWEEDVRLAHVNAAELRTPDGDAAASAVINWFKNVAAAGQLSLSIWGRDKYGRLLADVVTQGGHTLSDYVLSLPGTKPMVVAPESQA